MFEMRDNNLPGCVRKKDPLEAAADAILGLHKRGAKFKDEYPVLSDRQYERRRQRETFFGADIEELPARGVDYRRIWLERIKRREARAS